MSEIADANANPIGDINLKSKGVSTSGIVNLTDLTSSVYPNPSNDVATITYTLPEAGTVKVEVYNNTGVLVQTLVDMTQEAGLQNASFNTNDVQSGVYIYHITVQGETQTFSAVKRLIVVH
jgi:regulation of enolase protein 1 (concanavalin A-like superfamily)